jgi:elongation factor G
VWWSAFPAAGGVVLEPIMRVEISVPREYQGNVIGGLNKRKGVVLNSEDREGFTSIEALVPLKEMFGYSTDLRSATQGKGEFTMEYDKLMPVARNVQQEMVDAYIKKRSEAK